MRIPRIRIPTFSLPTPKNFEELMCMCEREARLPLPYLQRCRWDDDLKALLF
jgi:hypothetical protein